MSITTIAVSSTETRKGSGRAGSVTIRPRPDPVSIASLIRGFWAELASRTRLGRKVSGESEFADLPAVRRDLAGAELLVQHVERPDLSDHAGGVDPEALGDLQLLARPVPLDAGHAMGVIAEHRRLQRHRRPGGTRVEAVGVRVG